VNDSKSSSSSFRLYHSHLTLGSHIYIYPLSVRDNSKLGEMYLMGDLFSIFAMTSSLVTHSVFPYLCKLWDAKNGIWLAKSFKNKI